MSTIKAEAERCLKCKKPQCSKGCPVATPIPEVVNLFLESRLPEAGALLFANNPMTAVCSMVCPHEKNCYGHCILNKKGTPIQFFRIEQYVSQFYLDTFIPEAAPRNGKKVAVVGAGPAGITAAVLLARKGYRITLFDAMDRIGGALRYGLPDFRLPKSKLDQYKDILDALGVQFRPNTRVGTKSTAQDMMIDGHDAVRALRWWRQQFRHRAVPRGGRRGRHSQPDPRGRCRGGKRVSQRAVRAARHHRRLQRQPRRAAPIPAARVSRSRRHPC